MRSNRLLRFTLKYAEWLGLKITCVDTLPEHPDRNNPNPESVYLPGQGVYILNPKAGFRSQSLYSSYQVYCSVWVCTLLHEVNHYALANKAMKKKVDYGLTTHNSKRLSKRCGFDYRDEKGRVPWRLGPWYKAYEEAVIDLDIWVLYHIGSRQQIRIWVSETNPHLPPKWLKASTSPHTIDQPSRYWSKMHSDMLKTWSAKGFTHPLTL